MSVSGYGARQTTQNAAVRVVSRCALLSMLALLLMACAPPSQSPRALIKIDGSGTLFTLIEAAAELDGEQQQRLPIVIGSSGTGSGLNRLCRGELDIATASRQMTDIERQQCQQTGVDYIELPVAIDAVTVVVHPKNLWVDCLSPKQLKQIWQASAQYNITHWQQIEPHFAARPLHLYGPGTQSGTYDYFSRMILGKAHATRGDYAASEDDNVTVQGVAGDINGLGFTSMGYWQQNKHILKAVAIRQSDGQCEYPDAESIKNHHYLPLSRPLYIYVNLDNYQQNKVMQFFLTQLLSPAVNARLTTQSGLMMLSESQLVQAQQQLLQQAGLSVLGNIE